MSHDPVTCPCDCHNGWQRPCSVPGGCGLPTTTPEPTTTTDRAPKRLDVPTLEADIHDLTKRDGYLARLRQLLPDSIPGIRDSECSRHTKVTGSPAPWNDEAASLVFEIHAGARRHENHLRRDLGWAPIRRGTNDLATSEALLAIPRLVLALLNQPDTTLDGARKAATDIERWPRLARRILDDDPRADEKPHSKAPGGLTCPYCERPLILKHGWQYADTDEARALWCLRCPSTRDDVTPAGKDLSWPASAWLAVLAESGDTA